MHLSLKWTTPHPHYTTLFSNEMGRNYYIIDSFNFTNIILEQNIEWKLQNLPIHK